MNLKDILHKHKSWLNYESGGERADLSDADLRGSDLIGADLRGADLSDADLRDADLMDCIGNGKEIRTIQTEFYTINVTKELIWIGCKAHTKEEWLSFTDDEINEMDSKALEFWKKYKSTIEVV